MSASVKRSGYGRGAAILSVGIGTTGLITFAYFSLASYALPASEYGQVTLLWSAIFITVSVLYRPVEQLLSRTIADRDARGVTGNEHLRIAATIQLALGLVFVAGALLFSCNGRGKGLFGEANHDVGALRNALGDIPVAGFFAAGELGPVSGRNFVHGFTASMLLFRDVNGAQ